MVAAIAFNSLLLLNHSCDDGHRGGNSVFLYVLYVPPRGCIFLSEETRPDVVVNGPGAVSKHKCRRRSDHSLPILVEERAVPMRLKVLSPSLEIEWQDILKRMEVPILCRHGGKGRHRATIFQDICVHEGSHRLQWSRHE